ncbi:MAG TPA: tetraacyldisaccharide 4'-kinase [Bacteroidales bacterium]|nr:tetraacyldisaccharide 4'-kinase [Bacteroidales bacterium]
MIGKRNILLWSVSIIYGMVTGLRNFLYNTGVLSSREFSLPVICVGNITVGGTGKTPHCEYLIDLLKDRFRVALLSRGYRRKTNGFVMARPASGAAEIGDEPAEIKARFPDVTIAVDGNRTRGIENILREKPETEVIILDDGFQHRRITPGLSILLTDYGRLMIHDHLLPYGELRESLRNMSRADIILVTKCPPDLSPIQRRIVVKDMKKAAYQKLYFTTYKYGNPLPVFKSGIYSGDDSGSYEQKNISGVLILTGIANPAPFNEYVETMFTKTRKLNYPDHHNFGEEDLKRIDAELAGLPAGRRLILTTAKDAVRLRELTGLITDELKKIFYYIPVQVDFLNDDRDEFNRLITEYVRKNKRNNRIS